jgi:hypothetical protein
VRPFVGGEGWLDITPFSTNPLNVALMGEHGGFLFTWSSPRSTRFTPSFSRWDAAIGHDRLPATQSLR